MHLCAWLMSFLTLEVKYFYGSMSLIEFLKIFFLYFTYEHCGSTFGSIIVLELEIIVTKQGTIILCSLSLHLLIPRENITVLDKA